MKTANKDFVSRSGDIYFEGEVLTLNQLYNLSFAEISNNLND